MQLGHLIMAVAAPFGAAACSFGPIAAPSPRDPAAVLEREQIDARRSGERVNLCRMMSRDDPRYRDMDCKDARPGGAQ